MIPKDLKAVSFKRQIKSANKIIKQLKDQGLPTKEVEDTLAFLEIGYQKSLSDSDDKTKSLIDKSRFAADISLGTIASSLASQRIKSNLAVTDIQKITGFSRLTIHEIEEGKRDPHFKTLAVIAHILGYEIVLKKVTKDAV